MTYTNPISVHTVLNWGGLWRPKRSILDFAKFDMRNTIHRQTRSNRKNRYKLHFATCTFVASTRNCWITEMGSPIGGLRQLLAMGLHNSNMEIRHPSLHMLQDCLADLQIHSTKQLVPRSLRTADAVYVGRYVTTFPGTLPRSLSADTLRDSSRPMTVLHMLVPT